MANLGTQLNHAPFALHRQPHDCVGRQLADLQHQFVDIVDGLPIDRDDDVIRTQIGAIGRGSADHLLNQGPAVATQESDLPERSVGRTPKKPYSTSRPAFSVSTARRNVSSTGTA